MHISLLRHSRLTLAFVTCLMVGSCGNSDVADKQQPDSSATDSVASDIKPLRVNYAVDENGNPLPADYSNWQQAAVGNVKILFPPDHPHRNNMGTLAQTYGGALRADCRFLNIEVQPDTLYVFYYTGPGQGRSMTHEQYPFCVGDTLHQWPPHALGTPLIKYLLPRWEPRPTRHLLLEHGLKALLDNSGSNYHTKTLEKIDNGNFLTISQMVADTTFNSDVERTRSGIAASLVDFIIFHYGLDTFKALYVSEEDFDKAVRDILKLDIDSLQTQWLTTIKRATSPTENTGG